MKKEAMVPERILKMETAIAADYSSIAGMVVLKNGKAVYENYFGGCIEESRIHVFSVTKSVVSLLIGIALDKGCLDSIDQRVLELYPEYTVKRGEKTIQHITIRDMLTMTAPYKYKSTPYTKYFTSPDWVRYMPSAARNGKIERDQADPSAHGRGMGSPFRIEFPLLQRHFRRFVLC